MKPDLGITLAMPIWTFPESELPNTLRSNGKKLSNRRSKTNQDNKQDIWYNKFAHPWRLREEQSGSRGSRATGKAIEPVSGVIRRKSSPPGRFLRLKIREETKPKVLSPLFV